ncbi:hydrolase [Streptomyces viridochromogenes DSM 40736]|uniref:Hydrolase n=1 Tax=Streptomyces viridochromogenes (strain DSM 40736 / JCM 4977 / BCRC 1201 / Tue 494) TaxID=591159 RepID=D9XIK7_STRVT|nr:alpha/beta hydrolase [Streptomyces viridochromogenes]EFL32948.1 hydrolase [Streptomyces viridochromogenes DSM 40736]
MARRIDVTGTGGVRLAAWEFGDPPKPDPAQDAHGPGDTHGPQDEHGPQDGQDSRDRRDPEAEDGRAAPAGQQVAAPPASNGSPGVLLLHGLMGRASHWACTARWLSGRYRAVALDQRGHGRSDKPPRASFTRDAYVDDAESALEQLGLSPVVLIGHAMGALTAWQLAARRPDLVRGLIICDMRASALGAASQREWAQWFESWPLPFATLADVRKWFGEDDPWVERPNPARGEFYAEVMAESPDGWRPVFDPDQMLRSRETWVYDAHWEELAQVRCPALVVRGLDGELGRAEAQEMVRVLPRGQYAEVADAGHLVHYDQPEAWRAAIQPFLDALDTD